MKALAIAVLSVRRLLRERSNLFFVFAFPMLLILLIGLSFGGGSRMHVLVVGPSDEPLVSSIMAVVNEDEAFAADRVATRDLAMDALSRGRTDGVLVVPRGATAALAEGRSATVEIGMQARAAGARPALDAALRAASAPFRAASLARTMGASATSADALLGRTVPPAITVRTLAVGDDEDQAFANLGQFDLGASSQLLLFVFITTLGGATRIVESRDLGITRRMLAGPLRPGEIVLGEATGRFSVALFQSAWIVIGGLLLFNVHWGSPPAALLVVTAFAAAAAAGGLLLGALARTVSQASALATLIGLTFAALGGSMVPLDVFSPGLRRLAHLTPHAWANDAFAELTRHDGQIGDVLVEVAVLLGFAVIIGSLAAARLGRVIARG